MEGSTTAGAGSGLTGGLYPGLPSMRSMPETKDKVGVSLLLTVRQATNTAPNEYFFLRNRDIKYGKLKVEYIFS